MTNHEFMGWQAITESSRDHWTEDEIFRLNGRGAFYYAGGEDGIYMQIRKDGTLEVGSYEGAVPHIGEAMFSVDAEAKFADYNAAFTRTLELGGKKFLVDMFSAPNQDEIVKSAWAKIDAQTAEVPATDAPPYKLTQADMNDYGYSWPGMQPLEQDEALAHFDSGHSVLLLYPDDSEGYADSRGEIERFDGIFGFEIDGYVEPEISEAEEESACAGNGEKCGNIAHRDGVAFGNVGRIVFGSADYRESSRADGYTSVLNAIEQGKNAPKPPRKGKDENYIANNKSKNKGEERE